jgi:hypothetical protein
MLDTYDLLGIPKYTYGRIIFIDNYLTIPGEPYEQVRTWKERLFSRPWNPFKKTNTIIPQIPDPNVYFIGDDKVVMHPEIARKLLK